MTFAHLVAVVSLWSILTPPFQNDFIDNRLDSSLTFFFSRKNKQKTVVLYCVIIAVVKNYCSLILVQCELTYVLKILNNKV